ncbi:MAG: hypothetical protein HY534_06095 [Chloroflexi bacterium]|nr:hypothetical protein [Chloroflexota bacterium]
MAHLPHAEPLTAEQATRDARVRMGRAGSTVAMLILAILTLIGLFALISMIMGGPHLYSRWGYSAAALAFLASTAQAMPMVAFATRLAKGYWALPIRRIAEIGAIGGLVTTPLFMFLLFQLPDFHGRPSIWFDWPGGPQLWDSIMMALLTFTGLAILYFSSRPDRAVTRGTAGQGWFGGSRQWDVLTAGLVVLGAFYLMVFVFVHVFIVSDLAISLVPGWHSAIIPPYHAISGLQGGLATTLLTAGALRRFGGLDRYIGLDVFWGASKLLLGLSLLFFYLTWSELLTNWYGRQASERFLLDLFMFGPYMALFIASFCMNFVLPLALLIWNPIRVSIRGPIFVAGIIFFGNLIDRVRIYVASWSVVSPVGTHLEFAPPAQMPDLMDVLVFMGAVSAVGFLYLLTLRLVPAICLWELKTGLLLKVEQPFLKTEVAVVAKPR